MTDTKSLMWKYLDEFAVNHSMHDTGFIPLMLKNVGRLSKFQPPNAFWPSRTPHYGLNDYKTSSNQLDNALNLPQISMQKESRMIPDIIFFVKNEPALSCNSVLSGALKMATGHIKAQDAHWNGKIL